MTLEKHQLDGIPAITAQTLPASDFDELLLAAGYIKIGTAPAKGKRLKTWWSHPSFRRIEVIYSPDGLIAITAYHVD
jgi:hypothetical protein